MRKFSILIVALLLAVLAVMPATAQQGTIVDVAASNSEFSILVQAVQSANPEILELLSSPGNYTVFAPTNAAFIKFFNFLDIEADDLLNDRDLLTLLLRYHVIEGRVPASQALGLDGQIVPTLLPGTGIGITVNDGVITLNQVADVVIADVQASNGIVHAIEDVIFPGILRDELFALRPTTLLDIATGSDDFSTLVDAVLAANPAILETLGDRDAEVTVFAPTNEAFDNFFSLIGLDSQTAITLGGANLLDPVLLYHVIEGAVPAEVVLTLDGEEVATLQGETIAISIVDGGVVLNDTVNVIATDVEAINGIVHVIDAVLVPQETIDVLVSRGLLQMDAAAGEAATEEEADTEEEASEEGEELLSIVDIALANEDFSTLVDLVLAADPVVLETLSGEGEFTVFAPTNDAFEALFEMVGLSADDAIALGGAPLLTPVLLYHVIEGAVPAEVVVTLDGEEVETLLGELVLVQIIDGEVVLNGEVNVISTDIMASNGIIHVIDGVLLPQVTIETLTAFGLL